MAYGKPTFLEMVQSILSDMDSENVNSTDDSIEAQQIKNVIFDTYYDLVHSRIIPEHNKLKSLGRISNTAGPTTFSLDYLTPFDIQKIHSIRYNVNSDTTSPEWKELKYIDILEFMELYSEDDNTVAAVLSDKTFEATNIRAWVRNDKQPDYYTLYNDDFVVLDSWDSSQSTYGVGSRVAMYAQTVPSLNGFDADNDSFELDNNYIQYILTEAKSRCFSLFKGGVDQKIEQSARRQKVYLQNDLYKNEEQRIKRPTYGRR